MGYVYICIYMIIYIHIVDNLYIHINIILYSVYIYNYNNSNNRVCWFLEPGGPEVIIQVFQLLSKESSNSDVAIAQLDLLYSFFVPKLSRFIHVLLF